MELSLPRDEVGESLAGTQGNQCEIKRRHGEILDWSVGGQAESRAVLLLPLLLHSHDSTLMIIGDP